LDSADIIGDAYEYMIYLFASDAGKKGGEFFTPSRVSELVAKLVKPKDNDRIYDGTCGSGGLLLKAYKEAGTNKVAIYGQERNAQTWALCKMNMFLHNIPDATIWQGDTLANPQNFEGDKLMKFQVIVANPPFSLDKWDSGFLPDDKTKMSASLDPWKRFDWGIPPVSKGDYAFVCHMLHSLDDTTGRMGIVLPHGVLFRGAQEGKIRQTIIENFNLLDAVIGLPANLFFGAGIPACILIFKKNRPTRNVFFIDASGEGNYEKGKNQNILRPEDIERIVATYRNRTVIEKYSYDATFDEIKANDFNLNIPRYVDTFEEEPEVDIVAVQAEIKSIESELVTVQAQMAEFLKKLGI
jgi:type I restriction enzyme M protein